MPSPQYAGRERLTVSTPVTTSPRIVDRRSTSLPQRLSRESARRALAAAAARRRVTASAASRRESCSSIAATIRRCSLSGGKRYRRSLEHRARCSSSPASSRRSRKHVGGRVSRGSSRGTGVVDTLGRRDYCRVSARRSLQQSSSRNDRDTSDAFLRSRGRCRRATELAPLVVRVKLGRDSVDPLTCYPVPCDVLDVGAGGTPVGSRWPGCRTPSDRRRVRSVAQRRTCPSGRQSFTLRAPR